MALTLSLETAQKHSFALLQSMALMRMTTQELTEFLLETAQRNPLLIVRRPRRRIFIRNSSTDALEATAQQVQPGLHAHVIGQLSRFLDQGDLLQTAVVALVEELAETGWLGAPLDQIAARVKIPEDQMLAVLRAVQRRVEPTGLFAQDLRDCLSLQLEDRGELSPAMLLVLAHLGALEQGDIGALVRCTGLSREDVADCVARLRSLDPKPGARFEDDPALMREPDGRVLRDGAGWRVEFDRAIQPEVELATMHGPVRGGDMIEAQKQARALKHAIELRQSAMQQVIATLVARQQGFFAGGFQALVPMTMAEIATATGFHPSTVGRVLNGYLLDTPHGIIAARDLLSGAAGRNEGAPSRRQVVGEIHKLLLAEDPGTPLSDGRLADMLGASGMSVSRRLVAKYRQQAGFGPASERRHRA